MRFGNNALVSLAVSSGVFGTAAAAATAAERSGTFLRHAQRQRHLQVSFENCAGTTENFSFSFDSGGRDRGCTYANFRDRLNQVKGSGCAADADSLAAHLLGVSYTAGDTDTAPAEAKVDELCREGYAATPHKFDFDEITKKGPVFDNEYYSGGTYYNYEIQNDDGEHELAADAARIRRVYRYQAQKKTIDLPLYHEALDPEQDGCELDAMFCCWVQDRQAGDNNGNCNAPYGSHCVDSDPGDNTNFCYTDHARSGNVAAHVQGGFSVFADAGQDNGAENIEGAVHCHGFAWAQDDDDNDQVEATHPSAQYKGNNLFYVSLYDHMYQRGYVRNAPGSAMCGCAENMAVVTRADCTEIEAHETWTFDYDVVDGFAGVLSDVRDINFRACNGIDADGNAKNNDLEAYYRRLVRDGHQNQTKFETLQDTLVGTAHGQCRDAVKGFMRTKGILTESEFQAQAEAVSAETQSDVMVAAEFEAVSAETQTLGVKDAGQTGPEDDPDFVPVIDPEITYEESFPDDGTDTMPDVPTNKAEGEETPNFEDEVRLDEVDDVVDPQAFGGAVNELDLVPTAQTVNPPIGSSVAAVDDPPVVTPTAPTVSPLNPPPVDAPLIVPPVGEPPVVPTVTPVDQPNAPPATLGGRNAPCAKNSDCASNKCKGNQKCQAPAGTRRLATAWWK